VILVVTSEITVATLNDLVVESQNWPKLVEQGRGGSRGKIEPIAHDNLKASTLASVWRLLLWKTHKILYLTFQISCDSSSLLT
jgi:hypothetical protein